MRLPKLKIVSVLWPLAAVAVLAIPGALAIRFAVARKPLSQTVDIQMPPAVESSEAQTFSPFPPRRPVTEQPAAESPIEPIAPLVPDVRHDLEAGRAKRRAEEALARARRYRAQRTAPAAPKEDEPAKEPLTIHPPAKEDQAAIAAREALNKACVWLLANRRDWKTKKYAAKWQGTWISSDRQTARVAFGDNRNPECDVILSFDKLRNHWRVISVQGGGFPQGMSW